MANPVPITIELKISITVNGSGNTPITVSNVAVTPTVIPTTSAPTPLFAPETITVHIKTVTGKLVTIPGLAPTSTVQHLKERYQDKEGFPPGMVRLIYDGKQLHKRATLHEYGIGDQASVHLVLRLSGS